VKTVQAMAYGMPLLTTAWGSKGIETEEPMHNHPDLDSLAASLLPLTQSPAELGRLAVVSRERYRRFFDESTKNIEAMFSPPMLLALGAGCEIIQKSDASIDDLLSLNGA
jgi:hypothetical protein